MNPVLIKRQEKGEYIFLCVFLLNSLIKSLMFELLWESSFEIFRQWTLLKFKQCSVFIKKSQKVNNTLVSLTFITTTARVHHWNQMLNRSRRRFNTSWHNDSVMGWYYELRSIRLSLSVKKSCRVRMGESLKSNVLCWWILLRRQ